MRFSRNGCNEVLTLKYQNKHQSTGPEKAWLRASKEIKDHKIKICHHNVKKCMFSKLRNAKSQGDTFSLCPAFACVCAAFPGNSASLWEKRWFRDKQ